MIKLSDRLQVLADQIEKNETMADIGTDHGFLPISLWERHISPKVILTDISAGSLEKARVNARNLYPQENFDLRLGSGIAVLSEGEVDVVVIAGMGGILMTEILGADLKKAKSFRKLILQPRSAQGELRCWLLDNGFVIQKESLVRERKYLCPVLSVVPQEQFQGKPVSRLLEGCGPQSIEYEVPPWIVIAGKLAEEFVNGKIAGEEKILSGLKRSRLPDPEKEAEVRQRIAYLKSLLGGIKWQ